MASPRKYCYTCGTDEEHRFLTDSEKTWVKAKTGKRFVDDVLMCTAPGCRNLRTGPDKHPFDPIIRLP
jgi:hypothetical protein